MVVHSSGATGALVRISFLRRDQSNPNPAELRDVVPTKAVSISNDPVTELSTTAGCGALWSQSDRPLVVLSRIANTSNDPTAMEMGFGEHLRARRVRARRFWLR